MRYNAPVEMLALVTGFAVPEKLVITFLSLRYFRYRIIVWVVRPALAGFVATADEVDDTNVGSIIESRRILNLNMLSYLRWSCTPLVSVPV